MKEFVKMSREITQTGIEGGKERGTQVSADAADSPLHSGQGELGDGAMTSMRVLCIQVRES